MCAQRRFTICPKYVILAPSSQKKYKLAYEIQNINALSLLSSCLKNNYNNLLIIAEKIKHKFGLKNSIAQKLTRITCQQTNIDNKSKA